jgi:hypothetical protein
VREAKSNICVVALSVRRKPALCRCHFLCFLPFLRCLFAFHARCPSSAHCSSPLFVRRNRPCPATRHEHESSSSSSSSSHSGCHAPNREPTMSSRPQPSLPFALAIDAGVQPCVLTLTDVATAVRANHTAHMIPSAPISIRSHWR